MRERNHSHNFTLQLYLSGGSVCQFKWKKDHSEWGGGAGSLRRNYNGHSEKTVTFSCAMAFKAQT